MKVNISIDDELIKRADDYADNNYMSRSGLVSFALNNFLNQAEAIQCVKTISLAMQKIADTGNIDNETMEQLEDFQRFARMIEIK